MLSYSILAKKMCFSSINMSPCNFFTSEFFFQIKTKVEYCVTITVLLELEMAKRGCVQILQHGFRYQAIEIVSGKGVIETLFGQKRSFQKLQISSINLT